MANAPYHVFANGITALGSGLENWQATGQDALYCMLLGATSPASVLATAEFVSDVTAVSAEIAAGNGYTAGGVALPSLTWAATVANSWPIAAAVTTTYNVGTIVHPATPNGFLYQCVVTGTSGGTAPTWPTVVGTTVTDGTVTWLNVGTAVTVLGAGTITFTSTGAGFTASYGLVYDRTPSVLIAATGVTTTNASPTVTGTGFSAQWIGKTVAFSGTGAPTGNYVITAVASGTSLTISPNANAGAASLTMTGQRPVLGYYDISSPPLSASGGGTITITVPTSGVQAFGSS
jgi:hypothetical protein